MAREKLLTHKFQMMISEAEVKEIDEWMFQHRIKSRAQAIRQLVALGLVTEELIELLSLASMFVSDIKIGELNLRSSEELKNKSLNLQRKIVDIGIMLHEANLSVPKLDRFVRGVVEDILVRNGEAPTSTSS